MKAAVAGSTGFIGKFLLELLEKDNAFNQIDVLSRKPLELSEKFKVFQTDDLAYQQFGSLDVAFCALGTTIATAGSKDAFYHVDHDLVLAFAKNAKAAGAKIFVLVSSVGADAGSSNFYLKVKGETEKDLEATGFDSLIILRPSMLMGDRQEFRLGELIGKGVMKIVNPLMVGSLSKYRGIHGRSIAMAMAGSALHADPGEKIFEGDELLRSAFRYRNSSKTRCR
jgi:uncharacterized protein YbjT (DUF2867 family)